MLTHKVKASLAKLSQEVDDYLGHVDQMDTDMLRRAVRFMGMQLQATLHVIEGSVDFTQHLAALEDERSKQ